MYLSLYNDMFSLFCDIQVLHLNKLLISLINTQVFETLYSRMINTYLKTKIKTVL